MLGEVLKLAREKKNLTQKDVAENTHLLVQIVDDLEKDDFHRIAAAIYGRGFVKLYAEFLGLPAEQVDQLLRDFMQQYDGSKVRQVRTKNVPQQEEPEEPPRPQIRRKTQAATQETPKQQSETSAPLPPPRQRPTPVAVKREPVQARPVLRPIPQPEEERVPVLAPPPAVTPPSVKIEIPEGVSVISQLPIMRKPAAPEPPVPAHEAKPEQPAASGPAAIPEAAAKLPPAPHAETPAPQKIVPVAAVPTIAAKPTVPTANAEIAKAEHSSVLPEPVKIAQDFSGTVVTPENAEGGTEPAQPGSNQEDLFSIANKIVQLRTGKPVMPQQPEKKPASAPQAVKPRQTPQFVITMRRAAKISLETMTKAAHNSLAASTRAMQPAKEFISRKQVLVFASAGIIAVILLVFGIQILFRMTERQTTMREGAAAFPPPAMYAD